MVGVGFIRNGKIKLEASYSNSDLEIAIALGESLARHNNREVVIFLYNNNSRRVKILKRIKQVRTGFLWISKKVAIT